MSFRRVLEEFAQDVRYALRQHRRHPGIALLIVAILALGIGANVTMVSAIERLLLRAPPNVYDPERVARLLLFTPDVTGQDVVNSRLNYPTFLDLRREVPSLAGIAGFFDLSTSVGSGPSATEIRASLVTSSFFSVLGVRGGIGRLITRDKVSQQDALPTAVLSHHFWERRYRSDPHILGRTVSVGGIDYKVAGVAPKNFRGVHSLPIDMWLPLTPEALSQGPLPLSMEDRASAWLFIVGRMAPSATRELVNNEATDAWRKENQFFQISSIPPRIAASSLIPALSPDRPRGVNLTLWLGGVSILVLLTACANVANLLLARSFARRREFAVRLALGARRMRIVRQLLTEGMLLSIVAGTWALFLAVVGNRILQDALFADAAGPSAIDGKMLLIASVVVLGTGMLISLVPLKQSMSTELTSSLRANSATGGGRRSRTRLALLGTQAALSMVLLVIAGLFIQSLRRIEGLDLGVNLNKTLMVRMDLDRLSLPQRELKATYASILGRVRAVDGVSHAAFAARDPYKLGSAIAAHTPARRAASLWREGVSEVPMQVTVDSGFFRAVGNTSLRGRDFQYTDQRNAPRVAIVNEKLARLLWPNEDPLGKCMLVVWEGGDCVTVVGVTRGFFRGSILAREKLIVYLPMAQSEQYIAPASMFVAVEDRRSTIAAKVRSAIQETRSDLPSVSVTRMRDVVSPEFLPWQLAATMFALFGAIAFVIAIIGMYGVVAVIIAQRTQEIATRIALGARTANVLALVTREALTAVALGLLAGIVVTYILRNRVGPLLFQTLPTDPAIIVGVAVLLLGVGALACVPPTWRAARRDPAPILRVD